jgi:hypothetical protein
MHQSLQRQQISLFFLKNGTVVKRISRLSGWCAFNSRNDCIKRLFRQT